MTQKTTFKEEREYSGKLSEIRASIASIDEARRDSSISSEERELLELTSVTLRDAERIEIQILEKQVLGQLQKSVDDLKEKGREIRARVKRMNKAPKALDSVETVLLIITSIVKAAAKW